MSKKFNHAFRFLGVAGQFSASVAVLSWAFVMCDSAHAQKPMKEVHDDIVLRTAKGDNVEIHITYFQSNLGKETPVVILLHAEGSNRQVWLGKGGFAERLWNQGYAVIAVDLRKHGQSVVEGGKVRPQIMPADRQRMVAYDMEAVKGFLFKEHMAKRLNMNKTGIIAPEMSAAVAILYTMRDWQKPPFDDRSHTPRGQDIRTLILLSPEGKTKGLTLGANLVQIGKLAATDPAKFPAGEFSMLFFYGSKDRKDKRGETKRLYRKAATAPASAKRVLIKAYPFKYRGLELIGTNNVRTKCEEHMLGFLKDHLKNLTQREWTTRLNDYERDSGS